MSTKKSGGTSKNGRDSNPKYLGIKVNDGERTSAGSIIVRQRGTKFIAGKNVEMGKDNTIFAVKDGVVSISDKRKKHFDNTTVIRKSVEVK